MRIRLAPASMPAAGALVAGIVAAAVAVAACGGPGPTPTPTPPVGGASPSAAVASAFASAPPSAAASTSAASPSSPDLVPTDPAATPIPSGIIDASLLAILPATVDGVPVQAETAGVADALADPAFVANVQAAAFATVVDANDLASGVVARLRTGVYSDAFFRDWRDTYNQGACNQAGGVVGTVEAQLGGRTVYVTSCAGGLRIYHAYLASRDVVVSLISVGERSFGELLMEGLRP